MTFFRFLLFPAAAVYGIVVFFRNLFYDTGILPYQEFERGVLVIGNLSVGGTGKTPMTEYLIRLLKNNFSVATLSRGYKRHTRGFQIAESDSNPLQVGDEPLQFKKKFPDIIVAVDENRRRGIKKLFSQFNGLNSILLDDAFQHRRIKAGLSILLSDYNRMYYDDFLLPVGTLREWRSGKKRADVIVVTKCPDSLSPVEKRIIYKKINPEPHQHVFFSYIKYGDPVSLFGNVVGTIEKIFSVILLAGISNPKPLEDFLKNKVKEIIPFYYPDHHQYSFVEINLLIEKFNKIPNKNKIIITTEKDAMRLNQPGFIELLNKLPVYYIPIEITFDSSAIGTNEKEEFNKIIIEYVTRTNQKHSGTY